MNFPTLEPAIVWRHFETLCSIPHASGHEQALRGALVEWAVARGLACEVDEIGNLLIRKPATAGLEHRPGVVLQAHLDMVCQKNQGCAHDFLQDPIKAELKDGWLVASETTLGADNGIGVALALAAIECEDTPHPALEVLLTADEEVGMTGVKGLAPGWLKGSRLINLDTEEWGEFYLGCAGGVDIEANHAIQSEVCASGAVAYHLTVSGLKGGHSGCDIHLQRGNAIKLAVRTLCAIREAGIKLGLVSLEGGTARNALPREASAVFAVSQERTEELESVVARERAIYSSELAGVDEGFSIALSRTEDMPSKVVEEGCLDRLLSVLLAAPHGVRLFSTRIEGVVDTSNNLGVVRVSPDHFSATLMVRSLREAGTKALAAEIQALFALAGFPAQCRGEYPGWNPNPESVLLKTFLSVFEKTFSTSAGVRVIHAGLECGILASKYPGLDMVSFGPTIRGVHAPGERVKVVTVGYAWDLLRALLAEL